MGLTFTATSKGTHSMATKKVTPTNPDAAAKAASS